MFERGVRRGQFVMGLRVGWGEAAGSGLEGWTGYIDTYTAPGVQQWGLMLRYLVLF